MRRATQARQLSRPSNHVSIHARRATGDRHHLILRLIRHVSIHARRATGDRLRLKRKDKWWFQFTPVVRRATLDKIELIMAAEVSIHARRATGDTMARPQKTLPPRFQFTPVVRRATWYILTNTELDRVSIHARRATGDSRLQRRPDRGRSFNSRPSCDGRLLMVSLETYFFTFQFTPVVRRATAPP